MTATPEVPLVFLGFGYTAQRVHARLADAKREVWATTRDAARIAELEARGVRGVVVSATGQELVSLPSAAEVVVSFPPDGHSDAAWRERLPRAGRLVYVSSTAVYPSRAGAINEGTEANPDSDRGLRRLAAEQLWREVGAVALRVPAIYGPGRGPLERLRKGTHRIVGDGSGRVSRIHVDDLASCILSALRLGQPGSALLLGDTKPTTQLELISFICEREGLPLPASVPTTAAHATLSGDRAVDAGAALASLKVRLRYPSYREGLAPLLRDSTD